MKHETPPAFRVVEDFEKALCDYTGAPAAVAVDSCTNALRLCLRRGWACDRIGIPKYTYVGVPMAAAQESYEVEFTDEEWRPRGFYRLLGTPIWDSARLLTSGLWDLIPAPHKLVCLSFHFSKHLAIEHGGAILHGGEEGIDYELRAARHDGRTQGQPITNESVRILGHHCPMPPSMAAQGLLKLSVLPKHNSPLPAEYPDLSTFDVFKKI